jgi:CheY-like chemotaxis protein
MKMTRILVIDDDSEVRSLLRRILERAGYQVAEASDGREGIKICRSEPVRLVITDIIMPEMEGMEVIMALRREFPAIRVIAISGGARIQPHGYLIMAEKLGAHRTFSKPFDRKELLSAVRELMD